MEWMETSARYMAAVATTGLQSARATIFEGSNTTLEVAK
jgi:hypothetical protein